jgi:membrane protease YdiL (CAAX protease family)
VTPKPAFPPPDVTRREAWIAPLYFTLYLAYLTVTLESELLHWVTLVALPLGLTWIVRSPDARRFTQILGSLGLRRGNLTRGVGWAVLLGVAFSVMQAMGGSEHAQEIREVLRSGRVFVALPVALLAMMLTAGFTEEFFFRGFLQTRLTVLTRSRIAGVLISAVLFGVYHLPYAYLNPNWSSHGDLGAAFASAMGQGGIGGLVLGTLYALTRGNLIACIIVHSSINAIWFMTMIKFGGGG